MTAVAAAERQDGAARPRANIFSRLYRGETAFDFVGRKRQWFAFSALVILAGMVALGVKGLNFGIDFKGGTSWQVQTSSVTVSQARSALGPIGADATIVTLGSGRNRTLEVQADLSKASAAEQSREKQQVSSELARLAHVNTSAVSINDVGPTWGGQITTSAIRALIIFFVAITLYITIRFEWKMAVAALVAVLHDILVTVGIYALVGFPVTPATVVGVLTILGYSLYDTIVVFDRVKENARGLGATGRMTYSSTVNLSMNQVLMRSINTSVVAILPILSILLIGAELLGATTLQEFGLALLIGLTSGAYSSIFIASPLLAMLKEREPRYATIRQRLASRGAAATLLTPSAAAVLTSGGLGVGRAAAMRPARAANGGPPPRRSQDGPTQTSPPTGAGAPEPARGTAAVEAVADGQLDGAPGGDARQLQVSPSTPAPQASQARQHRPPPRPHHGSRPRPRKKGRRR